MSGLFSGLFGGGQQTAPAAPPAPPPPDQTGNVVYGPPAPGEPGGPPVKAERAKPADTINAEQKPETVGHPPDWLILPTSPDEEPPRQEYPVYDDKGQRRTMLGPRYPNVFPV
jgi:hypothetical protein